MNNRAGIARRSMLAAMASLPISTVNATEIVAKRRADGLFAFPDSHQPTVNFRKWFPEPVKLKSAELLVVGGKYQFLRVRSEAGVEGVVQANSRLEQVSSLFHSSIKSHFIGRDMRDLSRCLEDVYREEYKFSGLAFWTCVGHLELAIWDLLGKTAGLRCVEFMGAVQRTEIPIYVSSLSRSTSPEHEVASIEEAVARTGATGCKIKVGGRMSLNRDASPGWSQRIVSLTRERMGSDFTIYVDANGSYDAPNGIEMCKMLDDFGVAIFEEPCPHEDWEMTKQVKDQVRGKVRMKMAGGEQNSNLALWRWYIAEHVFDVLQPDFMYNGGMLRALIVQKMAEEAGVGIAPHYPRYGSQSAELVHFAAYAPNLYGLQEYRMEPVVHNFQHAPHLAPRNGKLSLPPGPGFGISYDSSIWRNATSN